MLVNPLRKLSSLARGMGQGIFGYAPCPLLSDETLNHIFLLVEQFTRDEWDQELETEQEMVYLGLDLSHVSRQWRRVALRTPSLWSGIRICQCEQPRASRVTLPKSTRHFLRYSSPLLLYLTVSAENYRILEHFPVLRVRSLVIYGTHEAIYDASVQWVTEFPALEDLIVEVSPPPPPPPTHDLERLTPVVGNDFFDLFPSMTWLTLRNVYDIPDFQRISGLRRLTWTMDPECELSSLSLFPFHDLTHIRYLELDVPNLTGGWFRIAKTLEEVVFKNAGSTIMNSLRKAFPPRLTSFTITSSEDITFGLLHFLNWRGQILRKLSLSLVDIQSGFWHGFLLHVPNVTTLEVGFTPTLKVPEPLNELMDALALHKGDTVLVPILSELRLAGDVLSRIARVVDFLRVRHQESEMMATMQRIEQVEGLVLPPGYFKFIPELLAQELESLVLVSSDAALNRLVDPHF